MLPLNINTTELDNYDIYTPLGLRFWDSVLNQQITQPLQVEACLQTMPARKVKATATYSKNYAFHSLPGWSNADIPTSPVSTRMYIVKVIDPAHYYTPIALAVSAPREGLVMAGLQPGSPGEMINGVFLYSAPSRRVSRWLGAVRGTLFDESTGLAAEHGVVKVNVPGMGSFYGIAQANGEFLVLLPYPSNFRPFQNSPGSPGGVDVQAQRWDISVEVLYQPQQVQFYPELALPDYETVLSQANADIRLVQSGASAQLLNTQLVFNRQLILQTETNTDGRLNVIAT